MYVQFCGLVGEGLLILIVQEKSNYPLQTTPTKGQAVSGGRKCQANYVFLCTYVGS